MAILLTTALHKYAAFVPATLNSARYQTLQLRAAAVTIGPVFGKLWSATHGITMQHSISVILTKSRNKPVITRQTMYVKCNTEGRVRVTTDAVETQQVSSIISVLL
jgi:hypothetical protein